MSIDWFTVVAQILNFFVLVWLLKRFLYKPIMNAIDERERKIASQLEDAAKHKADAKKEKEMFRQKNETFDHELDNKLTEVREKVELKKQRLFEEARMESEALQLQLKETFKKQEKEIKEKIKSKTKEEVLAIAGQILSDIAHEDLEDQIIRVFIDKIKNLNALEKAKFLEDIDTTKVTITSAFEISNPAKEQLEKAIRELNNNEFEISYTIDADVVSGIVLETQNFQLSWSVDAYLESLKADFI